jgi:hypothetical protein
VLLFRESWHLQGPELFPWKNSTTQGTPPFMMM